MLSAKAAGNRLGAVSFSTGIFRFSQPLKAAFYVLDFSERIIFWRVAFPVKVLSLGLLAECISRYTVGRINIETVGVSAALPAYVLIDALEISSTFRFLEFIAQMFEVNGI